MARERFPGPVKPASASNFMGLSEARSRIFRNNDVVTTL